MKESGKEFSLRVDYDSSDDTLSFHFGETPIPAVAEEAADEIWVRFEPETHRVVSIDVLNFSKRVHEVFGPSLTYTERMDPERLESLVGLLPPPKNEN